MPFSLWIVHAHNFSLVGRREQLLSFYVQMALLMLGFDFIVA